MTIQEAYALSAERQANLEYRRKIQRVKSILLGMLAGGALGGAAEALLRPASRSAVDRILRRFDHKSPPALGVAAGSVLGGFSGYGATRLQELLAKPDDLEQALKTVPTIE